MLLRPNAESMVITTKIRIAWQRLPTRMHNLFSTRLRDFWSPLQGSVNPSPLGERRGRDWSECRITVGVAIAYTIANTTWCGSRNIVTKFWWVMWGNERGNCCERLLKAKRCRFLGERSIGITFTCWWGFLLIF